MYPLLRLISICNDFLALVQNGTTAAQARSGKDIQGIPWDRHSITREKYRQTRLEQYRNYENIPHSGEGSQKVFFFFFCFGGGSFLYIKLLND